MIQRLRNAQNRGEPPSDPLVVVVERGIRDVMASGFRLSIVIADQRGNDSAVPAFQPRYIAVEDKVFAMLVMAAMANHVPNVVQERSSLQQHARLRRQMVHRLKLVEEQNAQLAHVLCVRLVFLQAARKASSADEQLPRGCIVAVRLGTGKSLA